MIAYRSVLVAGGLLLAISARPADTTKPSGPSPAHVTNPIKETDLTTVTLEPRAESRLGIVSIPVERKRVDRERLFSGTVVLPLRVIGDEGEARTLRFAPDPPASTVEVLKLAEAQTLADGAVLQAEVQLEAARVAQRRAETLLQSETGSQRTVDEARAVVALAETTLQQAQQQRSLLGAPVSETARLDRIWVKVPIYVGDLAVLDLSQEARVGGLADRPGAPTRPARSAGGPPSANPNAATIDRFYEMSNPDHALHLGQRVGVWLPLRGDEERLVVPWAAVLYDLYGGQWVYEATASHTFVRRRVQVARVVGQDAVLSAGPEVGVRVVTDGAAELFGTEFGAGH
jgi:hypothetical protein